jgi:hypothetical protein
MKKFLTCVMLAMFTASLAVGCKASGEVGDDDMDHDHDSSYKKTTSVKTDGDTKTTKTEVKRD